MTTAPTQRADGSLSPPVLDADFAAMADNLPEMAWISKPTGEVIWFNKRWYDYTGASVEDMLTGRWRLLHPPEIVAAIGEKWVHAMSTGEPFEMTLQLRGVDGVFRPFLSRARPLRNAAGEITSWFGVSTDISSLNAASMELANQKRVAETLNRTAAKVAAELHLENLVQIVVDAALELTGAKIGAFFYNVVKEDGESYTLHSLSGEGKELFAKFPMPRATEVFRPTFRGTGVVRSGDITRDERYGKNTPHKGMPDGHPPVRSYLAAPVISRQGEVMGGLFFGHPDADQFDEHDEQIVVGLAAQAAVGIDNSRLFEKAQNEIAERKQAEASRTLVLRELNHRVKNLFAVTTGMISMTARVSSSPQQMAETLNGRLRALARAHELIRTSLTAPIQGSQDTTLAALVASILMPHASPHGAQLAVSGPSMSVGPNAATSLALILHELATNAAKYGALTASAGSVSITWRVDGSNVVLTWTETGGPAISGPPARKGFGVDLAQLSARGQLGGDIAYNWKTEGVVITLRFSLERLVS